MEQIQNKNYYLETLSPNKNDYFDLSRFSLVHFKNDIFSVTFNTCTFKSSDFENISIRNNIFEYCTFIGCVFDNVIISGNYLINNSFFECIFYKCSIDNTMKYNYFYNTSFKNSKLPKQLIAQTTILPDGDLIGWKKLRGSIAKLLIPADAKRSNATGRKCRASYAKVLEIYNHNGAEIQYGFSQENSNFKYTKG